MSLLLIRPPPAQGGPAEWALTDPDGAVADRGEVLSPFAGQLAGLGAARRVLLVPGEAVVAHSVHLPAAGAAQTRAAARFAIEDELGVDPAGVHLAVAPPAAPGAARLVFVVDRAALHAWLAAARALGVEPDAALPEWAAVPAGDGEAGALITGGIAHINLGPWGFSAEPDLAGAVLGRALERFDIGGLAVWGGDLAAIAPPEGWGGRAVEGRPLAGDDGLAALLARGAAAATGADLLQAEFAPRRQGAFRPERWRRAAILAVCAFAVWIGLTLAEAAALNRRAEALRGDAEAVFAEAFPEVARIVNPQLQMRTQLSELRGRGGGSFLDLAALLAGAVEQRPGVEIAALRYDQNGGALSAELVFSDFEDLQALGAVIAAEGGVLEEGASRQAGGRMSGDVTVRLP